MISRLSEQNISRYIPPNYSSWQTIELSYQCAADVIARNVPGVFVECGVGAGNNFAAMLYAGREGYGFDSFEGIPWAGPNDDVQPGMEFKDISKHGILESSGITAHTIDNVRADLKKWGLKNYHLVPGWFQNTVQHFTRPISVLRLDGDLYESTMVPLVHLYPLLSVGGYLIIDDWELAGVQKAFREYFKDKAEPELVLNDGPTYWMK